MKYVNKTTNSGKVVKLKNYKRRARINRLKRRLLLLLLIIITVITVLTNAPFMRIKTINCYGNETISSKDIVKSSSICIGNNIFRINKNKAKESIYKNPYVKNVYIKRKLPSTISIDITECQVSAYIKNKEQYIYIDDDSKVLEISDIPPQNTVPIVNDVVIKTANPNTIIEFKNNKQAKYLSLILKTINNSEFKNKTTLINVKDINDMKITINNSLEIRLGDEENLDYKINFLAIGAYKNIGENTSGVLDVSYGNSAVFKENK